MTLSNSLSALTSYYILYNKIEIWFWFIFPYSVLETQKYKYPMKTKYWVTNIKDNVPIDLTSQPPGPRGQEQPWLSYGPEALLGQCVLPQQCALPPKSDGHPWPFCYPRLISHGQMEQQTKIQRETHIISPYSSKEIVPYNWPCWQLAGMKESKRCILTCTWFSPTKIVKGKYIKILSDLDGTLISTFLDKSTIKQNDPFQAWCINPI